MAIQRPKKGEFAPFHETYLNAVPKGALLTTLKKSLRETQIEFSKFIGEHENFAYADGKWTIKQMLAHIIDTERVFAFRALWFSKKDYGVLAGFNQDHWMEATDVSNRTVVDLLKEFKTVRESSIFLIKNMADENSKFIGTASNWKTSARTMAFCVAGHNLHHLQILRERYFVA